MIFLGIIALLAIADLCIKNAIEDQEDCVFPKELEGSDGNILLYKNHNPGFSFGLLKSHPRLVQTIPLVTASFLTGILAWLLPRKGNLAEKLALSMTIGGAASNLYDRMVRGYVVDYFSIQHGKLKKVVLNLGDVFIFLGAFLMLVTELFRSLKKR